MLSFQDTQSTCKTTSVVRVQAKCVQQVSCISLRRSHSYHKAIYLCHTRSESILLVTLPRRVALSCNASLILDQDVCHPHAFKSRLARPGKHLQIVLLGSFAGLKLLLQKAIETLSRCFHLPPLPISSIPGPRLELGLCVLET